MKEKKRFKLRGKYLVALIVIAVCLLCYAFDFAWSKTYDVEIISVSTTSPVADSKERVEIKIQVTHFGKKMEGHEIFALPSAGKMVSYTAVTDEEGMATLVYTPYTHTLFTPAKDVEIVIRDQSNSIFWEVNAFTELTLKLLPKGN